MRMKRWALIILTLGVAVRPLPAYIDAAPTLGRIIRESSAIAVLEVVKVSPEKRVVVYRKVADLKGQSSDEAKHQLTDGLHPREPKLILDWAQPGKRAVCFVRGPAALICIGPYWYETAAKSPPWWTMTRGRSELSLAYFGTADRLQRQLTAILAGREATITVVRHKSNEYNSFEAVAFKHL